MELPRHGRPSLDEQLHHPLGSQLVEELGDLALELGAGAHQCLRGHRSEHDPARIDRSRARKDWRSVVANRQGGVVAAYRTRADEDRIGLGAQAVPVRSGLGRGDPLAGSVGGRGPAVECRSELQNHVRPTGAPVGQVGRQLVAHLFGLHSHVDLDARVPQSLDPVAGDQGVGILDSHHDPGHTRGADGIDARRCPPLVAARFEGHVEGGPPRTVTSGLEGIDLRMGSTGFRGGTAEEVTLIGAQDSANPGIGGGDAADLTSSRDGARHAFPVDRTRVAGGLHHRNIVPADPLPVECHSPVPVSTTLFGRRISGRSPRRRDGSR